jgi:hypothetical protein
MIHLAALLALVCAMLPGHAWGAARLYFRAEPARAAYACPDPCFRIHVFVEDPSRGLSFQALQFDIDVLGGAPVCLAADRLYAGSFAASWRGGAVALRVGHIDGIGTGVIDPVSGLGRLEGAALPVDGLPSATEETDGDLWPDLFDNCPEDRDGDSLADACDLCPDYDADYPFDNFDRDSNGIGNVCECGDAYGDGIVDAFDLTVMSRQIFGSWPQSPLCDTNFDGLCTVSDIIGAHLKMYGRPAKMYGRPAYCSRYPPPRRLARPSARP